MGPTEEGSRNSAQKGQQRKSITHFKKSLPSDLLLLISSKSLLRHWDDQEFVFVK